jgi:hypothetical protein
MNLTKSFLKTSTTYNQQIIVKLLLGFVLSLFMNSAFAQNFDSLWSIWQDPSAADTSRINAALSLAADLDTKQPLRSVDLGEAVMERVEVLARTGVLSDSLADEFKIHALKILSSAYSYVGDKHRSLEALLENSMMDYTICRAPMITNKTNETGAIATKEGHKPANTILSRNSAAAYFIEILEQGRHIRETVSLSNIPED